MAVKRQRTGCPKSLGVLVIFVVCDQSATIRSGLSPGPPPCRRFAGAGAGLK